MFLQRDAQQNLQLECSTNHETWYQKIDFALIEMKSGCTITGETTTSWSSKDQGWN